jgi:hypothetical protein
MHLRPDLASTGRVSNFQRRAEIILTTHHVFVGENDNKFDLSAAIHSSRVNNQTFPAGYTRSRSDLSRRFIAQIWRN